MGSAGLSRSHMAEIKMRAGLGSYLEALGENLLLSLVVFRG